MPLILPIGDCHVDDQQSLDRFNIASKFIVDKKPDYIIIMGDFLTLNCLSAWDKDKRKKMEGRRYAKEIEAGNEALDRLMSEIISHNKQKRKNKEKQYKPELVFLEGNHCVAPDTEVLTISGWKQAKDITTNDYIPTVDLSTNAVEWNKPSNVTLIPNQKMYRVMGDDIDEFVSEGHSLIFNNERTVVSTIEGTWPKTLFKFSAQQSTKANYTDDEIKVITWLVTDGHMRRDEGIKTRLQWKLSNSEKIERLKGVLENAGIKYTFKMCKKSGINKLQPYYIRVYGDDARKFYEMLDHVKQFPKDFLNFNKEQCDIFLSEVEATDGHAVENRLHVTTVNEDDANIIQQICIMNNYPCKITSYNRNQSGFKNGKKQYLLKITVKDNNAINRKVRIYTEGEVSDTVAISVKNRTFFARRNGKVSVTGNCDRLTRYLDYDPTFDGHVGVVKDLKLKERGFIFVPYREYYYVGKVGFTHIPFNKSAPISGVDITRKAQMVTVNSVVFGHTHEEHLSHVHKEGMPHLQDTYNCGCFFDKKEDYVQGCVTNYWRGLSLLTNWKEGRFDVDSYSLGRLERLYGDK